MASNRQTYSGRGRGRGYKSRSKDSNRDGGTDRGKNRKLPTQDVDENSPVIKAFRSFQAELDNRNDRYERIVKLSRDITIESKRLIFLLQRVVGSEDRASLLAEAEEKMKELHASKFMFLAKELDGQDPYQFLKAFSPGLQEYIEAVTFYHYLLSQKLVGVDVVQADLIFNDEAQISQTSCQDASVQKLKESGPGLSYPIQDCTQGTSDSDTQNCTIQSSKLDPPVSAEPAAEMNPSIDSRTHISVREGDQETRKIMTVHIPPAEYMLGVADFTGELMRMAINSVGAGDLDTPREVGDLMRVIHAAFTSFGNASRELHRKTTVLRQSLQKVENACYTLKVRGSEIPKHMLADVFSSGSQMDNFNAEDPTDEYE